MMTSGQEIELYVDPDDEFSEDYEGPSGLTAESVSGTVVYTLDWSVSTIVDQIDADPDDPNSRGVLVTAPPFQRRTAWNEDRQSLFIESLMLGLPIPPLVLAESITNPGQFYVLDGKQRLTALKRFILDPTKPLRLRGLEILHRELNGATYDEIRSSRDLRRYVQSMHTQPVRTIVVRAWKTPALLHLIFSRLNRASVPLASHELRQALYPGRFTNFINQHSSESVAIQRARRLNGPDFRLRDAETLLRYMAFKSNVRNYSGDLRDFLDRVLKGGNDHFVDVQPNLSPMLADLDLAVETTFDIFGKTAFLRFEPTKRVYLPRFNVAVFDLMTWFFGDPEVSERARAASVEVVKGFERLCVEDAVFAGYLTATTKTSAAVRGRLRIWGETLAVSVGMDLDWSDFENPIIPIGARERY